MSVDARAVARDLAVERLTRDRTAEWDSIRRNRQIYDAGLRHHDCCRSLAEVADHEQADLLPADIIAEAISKPIGDVVYQVRVDVDLLVWVWRDGTWVRCGRLDTKPRDGLQLVADHFAWLLDRQRHGEQLWRGEVTAERIEADHAAAITANDTEEK